MSSDSAKDIEMVTYLRTIPNKKDLDNGNVKQ
nr:MAG TPA: hypothetical protein [Caudoviricetes sp.]